MEPSELLVTKRLVLDVRPVEQSRKKMIFVDGKHRPFGIPEFLYKRIRAKPVTVASLLGLLPPEGVVLYDEASIEIVPGTELHRIHELLVFCSIDVTYVRGGFNAIEKEFPHLITTSVKPPLALLDIAQKHRYPLDTDPIDGFIIIGASWDARNSLFRERRYVTSILDLTDDSVSSNLSGKYDVCCLPLKDDATQDILSCLPEAIKVIKNHKGPGNLLVHCHAGISRSPAIVIGYLMSTRRCSFDEALAIVREHRAFAEPNFNFCAQLRTFTP